MQVRALAGATPATCTNDLTKKKREVYQGKMDYKLKNNKLFNCLRKRGRPFRNKTYSHSKNYVYYL